MSLIRQSFYFIDYICLELCLIMSVYDYYLSKDAPIIAEYLCEEHKFIINNLLYVYHFFTKGIVYIDYKV